MKLSSRNKALFALFLWMFKVMEVNLQPVAKSFAKTLNLSFSNFD